MPVIPQPRRKLSRARQPIPFTVTCAGYGLLWPSTRAVQAVEADYSDLAASAQEGASIRPADWNTLATRYASAVSFDRAK